MSNFEAAFEIVVGVEGGYVNDPDDPGGETKYGISKRMYPSLDIANLTREQAQSIYLQDYWNRCKCDTLSWEWALCLFDCAVNQGPGAASALKATSATASDFMAERARRYALNPSFATYGLGWMRRLFTISKAAQVTPA